jgi:hypothetical protein
MFATLGPLQNSTNTMAMTLKGSIKVTSCNVNKQITFSERRETEFRILPVLGQGLCLELINFTYK